MEIDSKGSAKNKERPGYHEGKDQYIGQCRRLYGKRDNHLHRDR
jgi:hypothetical protein